MQPKVKISSALKKESDRLKILSDHINEVYRWGTTRRLINAENDFDNVSSRMKKESMLDDHQRQELEEISNLNRNIDISGNDIDHIFVSLIQYHNDSLDEDYFQRGIKKYNLDTLAERLWKELTESKQKITHDVFASIFRSCRINALFASYSSIPLENSTIYSIYYDKNNIIRLTSTKDCHSVFNDLNATILNKPDNYVQNFRFLHIDGITTEIVQLLGAVINLDLDTILNIKPNCESIECNEYDNYIYFSLPWLCIQNHTKEEDSWVLTKSILHILVFIENNWIITLSEHQDNINLTKNSMDDVESVLNMNSVVSTIKRFHSRYHSCIAVLLYLFDLHIDRIVQVILQYDTRLNYIEDSIVLSGANEHIIALGKPQYKLSVKQVFALYTSVEKLNSICTNISALLSGMKNAIKFLSPSYYSEFQLSEFSYNIRDIQDHAQWYVEEGLKMYDSISDKYDIANSRRRNNLFYIVTVFQSVFLPLQTVTAVYGMNFDEMPEYQFKYSYPIFWIIAIIYAIVIIIWVSRFYQYIQFIQNISLLFQHTT